MANAFTVLEAAGRLAWQASWHGAVLAILVLVCSERRIVRRTLSPGGRSALWLLVCARLALPLAPTLPTSIHNLYRVSTAETAGSVTAERPVDESPQNSIAPTAKRPPETDKHAFLNEPSSPSAAVYSVSQTNSEFGPRAVLMVWLAGLIVVGLRYALGVWRLQRVVGSCDDVRDERVLTLADECRQACGLAARPALKHVPGAFGPTVAGFWRPTLLLSDATLRMDWQSLRFILLHEMRHIRTGDCFVAWLLRGLTAIHWFNPFCWMAGRAWQAERELACDAWVLRHADGDERRDYGRTLLQVVEQTSLTDAALFATGMASRPRLLERRIREMKRPMARSRWQHAAAVLTLVALGLVGFADPVRSQPAPATDGVSQSNASTPATTASPAPPSRRAKQRKEITIIFAEHVILVREMITQNADLSENRIVTTWDQLEQILREAAQTSRIVPMFYGTNGSVAKYGFTKYGERTQRIIALAKELKAPTYYLSFVGPNGSKRYDAIRAPADLKPDLSRRRDGMVRLANGQPAVSATVVLQTRGEYECCKYLRQTELRDLVDEVWIKTDDHGRFHFYPNADDFAVAALHPTGFGLATGVELARGQAITLAPWGQVEMKGNSETGISATRTGEGKNPIKMNLQTFSHTGKTVPMPAGRVWIQRVTGNKVTGDTLVVVGPGETKAVTIDPPAQAEKAKPGKDAPPAKGANSAQATTPAAK
jgi:beta-lactamase regulating signal transducer with metallopeptidase domain